MSDNLGAAHDCESPSRGLQNCRWGLYIVSETLALPLLAKVSKGTVFSQEPQSDGDDNVTHMILMGFSEVSGENTQENQDAMLS